jgi:hypothetical protein
LKSFSDFNEGAGQNVIPAPVVNLFERRHGNIGFFCKLLQRHAFTILSDILRDVLYYIHAVEYILAEVIDNTLEIEYIKGAAAGDIKTA